MIDQFGEDLTQAAMDGKLDPIIGRSLQNMSNPFS